MPKQKKKREQRSTVEREDDELPSNEPDEEQGIKEEVHGEDEELEMETGEKDAEIYDETGREVLTEDDDITDAEEGFMKGYSASAKVKKKPKKAAKAKNKR